MTVKVNLYTFTKKANSTKKPTSTTPKLETEGYIKSPSSLLNPVVELSVEPLNYQYAYIYEFKRYYFITDIVFNKGLWLVSLRVDVMGTYKTTIGASTSYILRAAASGKQNPHIIDNAFPLTGAITTAKESIEAQGTASFNSGYYYITVTGNQMANGKTVYMLTPALFSNLISSLFTTADGLNWGDLTQGVINSLMNPIDYISSVIWLPWALPTTGTQHMYLGLWDSGLTCDTVSGVGVVKGYTVNVPKHPQAASYGAYCNMAPYSQYFLDLGFTGIIPLDTTRLVDVSSIYISVAFDAVTGTGRVYGAEIVNGSNLLFDVKTQLGVPIPMSQVSTSIGNVVADTIEAVGDYASGNYTEAVLDSSAWIGSVISAISGSMTTKGTMGSIISHSFDYNLYARFFTIAARDKTNMGVPYCAYVKPSTCSGYQKVANAHIALTDGLDPEVQEINAIMEAGFYYE
jgi:hypothetical protein